VEPRLADGMWREILKDMFDRQIQKIVDTISLELRVVGETVVVSVFSLIWKPSL
jgi:hypothetical protein